MLPAAVTPPMVGGLCLTPATRAACKSCFTAAAFSTAEEVTMKSPKNDNISRRRFVRGTAAAGVMAGSFPYFVRGARKQGPIKVGLVGCGGRGTGAMLDCIAADGAVRFTAMAAA